MKTIKFLMVIMAIAMLSCSDESIRVNNGGGDDDDDPILIPPPPDDEINTVPIDTLSI